MFKASELTALKVSSWPSLLAFSMQNYSLKIPAPHTRTFTIVIVLSNPFSSGIAVSYLSPQNQK